MMNASYFTEHKPLLLPAAQPNRSFSVGSIFSTGIFNEMAFESFVSHMKQIAKVNKSNIPVRMGSC